MKKAQTRYSSETLKKLYEKLLKTPSKKMSEPSKDETRKFKLGGKTKKKLTPKQKEMTKTLLTDDKPENDKVAKAMMGKKKKGGCVGPKYMCGGKKKMKKGGKGLYHNINERKRKGISRDKDDSTISKEAYSNMKKGFPKKKK